jgi:glycosyltransferase involved in cell wall biosynthesis
MRILHIITRREFRGAEMVATDLCEELRRRGHEVLLVGLFQPVDAAEADAIAKRVGRVLDVGGPKRRGVALRLAMRLRRTIQQYQPDVVQANAFNALKFAALAKMSSRARWPLVYRNVGLASQWVTRRGQRLWGRFLLRQVDQIVSVSEASRADFAKTYSVPAERILVARQGVKVPCQPANGESHRRLAAVVGCAVDSQLLIHVGNFSPEKNHAGLLDAFERVRARYPESHLVLVGNGPLRSEVERRVADSGLKDSVHLVGARSDAAELIAAADVLLLASHVEGIPGTALEACAAGVPVVTTNVGGLAEIIRDGVTGQLVAAGDMAALADATCRLLGDDTVRQRLGAAARQFVQENYGLQASVDKLEGLYAGLVRGSLGR